MRHFGLPAADIDNPRRLKLKFTAGKIKHIGELVDTAVVGDDPGEIAPGVLAFAARRQPLCFLKPAGSIRKWI